MVDPDEPQPQPEPQPDVNLSIVPKVENVNLTLSTATLQGTVSREGGINAEDLQGWEIVDPTNTLIQTKVTVSNSGTVTFTIGRADPTSFNNGIVTMKLQKDGATYATVNVTYTAYASITTDSTDKLLTDGPENVTAIRINGKAVENMSDYTVTSSDETAAIVNQNGENITITPLKAEQVIFYVAKASNPDLTLEVKITFKTPGARIGDTYYLTLTKALKEIKSGETVILNDDIIEAVNFAGSTPRVQDFEFTLDLNGHTLTAPATSSFALRVDYGTVTVIDSVGTGGINYGKDYAIFVGHLAGDYPSKLILDGGTYTGKTSVAQAGLPGGNGSNYKYYGGDLIIKNGTFRVVPDEGETYDENGNFKYLLNMLDMNPNAYAGGIYSPSSITVEGGRFEKFDPANNLAEGPNTNFVAEGYQSVKEGDWYIVSAI